MPIVTTPVVFVGIPVPLIVTVLPSAGLLLDWNVTTSVVYVALSAAKSTGLDEMETMDPLSEDPVLARDTVSAESTPSGSRSFVSTLPDAIRLTDFVTMLLSLIASGA